MVRRCMNVMPYDETAFDVHVAMIVSSLGAGHSTYFRFFFVLPFHLFLLEQKSFRHYCAGRNTTFQENAKPVVLITRNNTVLTAGL
jgi:hypothetical protein